MSGPANSSRSRPPRWTSVPFPPYTFVPGRAPHPRCHPEGHSHDAAEPERHPLGDWRENETWLLGVDLYNHGYHWEAHEAWESIWHGEGRRGVIADLLKGLIQTTAAHVKCRQGAANGVRILGDRSRLLLENVGRECPRLAGLDVPTLVAAHRHHFATAAIPDPESVTYPALLLEVSS